MIRIKELRVAKGLTQAQLAERAGISRSYLTEMENETKPINSRRLARVASVLGVEPGLLLDPKKKPSAQNPEAARERLIRLYDDLPQAQRDELLGRAERLYLEVLQPSPPKNEGPQGKADEP